MSCMLIGYESKLSHQEKISIAKNIGIALENRWKIVVGNTCERDIFIQNMTTKISGNPDRDLYVIRDYSEKDGKELDKCKYMITDLEKLDNPSTSLKKTISIYMKKIQNECIYIPQEFTGLYEKYSIICS